MFSPTFFLVLVLSAVSFCLTVYSSIHLIILYTKMHKAGLIQLSSVFATLAVFSIWTSSLQTSVSADPSDMHFSVMKTDERISTTESTVRIQSKTLQKLLIWWLRGFFWQPVWPRKQFVPPWLTVLCWRLFLVFKNCSLKLKPYFFCSLRMCSREVQWLAMQQIRVALQW